MKKKIRTVKARVVGPVPRSGFHGDIQWRVRLVATNFPFFIDTRMNYADKADADKVAERWKKIKVSIRIER